MKLISMVDFVFYYKDECKDMVDYIDVIENYAKFLKQPLTLGMFVPCDLDGNVLDKPEQYEGALEFAVGKDYDDAFNYQQAKKRVLFEGFEVNEFGAVSNGNVTVANVHSPVPKWDIESLTRHELTLTPNAIKQLEL